MSARKVNQRWRRADDAPRLYSTSYEGTCFQGGHWGHSLEDFFRLKPAPSHSDSDISEIWSRSQIQQTGENYAHFVHPFQPESPRVRKPWPILMAPREGSDSMELEFVNKPDEGCIHEGSPCVPKDFRTSDPPEPLAEASETINAPKKIMSNSTNRTTCFLQCIPEKIRLSGLLFTPIAAANAGKNWVDEHTARTISTNAASHIPVHVESHLAVSIHSTETSPVIETDIERPLILPSPVIPIHATSASGVTPCLQATESNGIMVPPQSLDTRHCEIMPAAESSNSTLVEVSCEDKTHDARSTTSAPDTAAGDDEPPSYDVVLKQGVVETHPLSGEHDQGLAQTPRIECRVLPLQEERPLLFEVALGGIISTSTPNLVDDKFGSIQVEVQSVTTPSSSRLNLNLSHSTINFASSDNFGTPRPRAVELPCHGMDIHAAHSPSPSLTSSSNFDPNSVSILFSSSNLQESSGTAQPVCPPVGFEVTSILASSPIIENSDMDNSNIDGTKSTHKDLGPMDGLDSLLVTSGMGEDLEAPSLPNALPASLPQEAETSVKNDTNSEGATRVEPLTKEEQPSPQADGASPYTEAQPPSDLRISDPLPFYSVDITDIYDTPRVKTLPLVVYGPHYDPFSVDLIPKLEEFIPDRYLPDILVVHDPSNVTDYRYSKNDQPFVFKYKRVNHYTPASCNNPEENRKKNVAHLYLHERNRLGSGHWSRVYGGSLKLPQPLTAAYSPNGHVSVAVKLNDSGSEARQHLKTEGRIYSHFPKSLMEDHCGFATFKDCQKPVPLGPVVPKFFGHYIPIETPYHPLPSPILLLENCGTPCHRRKGTRDEMDEVFSLFQRLHDAGFVQGSAYRRNMLVQPGPLTARPEDRSMENPSYRILDFGRGRMKDDCRYWRDHVEEEYHHALDNITSNIDY